VRVVAAAARLFRGYALVLAVAAAAIVAALLDDGGPDGDAAWLGVAFAAVLAAIPPVLLFLFSEALRSLATFPERVRNAPRDVRTHADEAQRLFARRGLGSILLLPFRLLRLGSGARETLTPYVPLLPLVSVPFLAAAGLAALVGLLELLLGVAALADLAR
jgi:hypothetical protein